MSYGFPNENPPRNKKAGGGMFFLVILAVGAYLIFSSFGQGPNPDGGGILDGQNGAQVEREANRDGGYLDRDDDILGRDNTAQSESMPTTGRSGSAGDWEMQDVATQRNAGASSAVKTSPTRTESGDWAIEEVDGKKKDNSQFQFSNKNAAPANTASGGDWEIEEVKKPTKTESGDWAIEETNTSTKKDDK